MIDKKRLEPIIGGREMQKTLNLAYDSAKNIEIVSYGMKIRMFWSVSL